jgi:hypothetical protein
MKMDKDVLPLKGSLQKDFLAILRIKSLQVEFLLRKPIGLQG